MWPQACYFSFFNMSKAPQIVQNNTLANGKVFFLEKKVKKLYEQIGQKEKGLLHK